MACVGQDDPDYAECEGTCQHVSIPCNDTCGLTTWRCGEECVDLANITGSIVLLSVSAGLSADPQCRGHVSPHRCVRANGQWRDRV